VQSQESVDEGVVEGVDGTEAIKRSPKDTYCKKRIGFEKHAAELESKKPTRAFQNVTVMEIEEQRPSTSADPHVTASLPPVNLESVRNIDEEKPTTSKRIKRKEVESDSADDVVVLGSVPVPEEREEDRAAASRSHETQRDGPVQQDKIDKDVDGNVVVV